LIIDPASAMLPRMARERDAWSIPGEIVRIFMPVVLVAALSPATSLAAGELDPTFGIDGKVLTDVSDRADFASDVALDPATGRIVVLGTARDTTSSPPPPGNGPILVRYEPDGELDPSFSEDGKATPADTDVLAHSGGASVAVQPDHKVVVAGSTKRNLTVFRLDEDGEQDPSFSGDGVAQVRVAHQAVGRTVLLTPAGKLMVVGYASLGRRIAIVLARFTPDGELDDSFSGDGIRVARHVSEKLNIPLGAALQPDGRIVVAGVGFTVARFRPSGRLDRSFSGNGWARAQFPVGSPQSEAIALQDNGRIVLAGQLVSPLDVGGDASYQLVAVARFRHGGPPDRSFSGDGRKTFSFTAGHRGFDDVSAVAALPSSRLVVAGSRSYQFDLAVLEPDGTPSSAFSDDGRATVSFPHPPSDHQYAESPSSVAVVPDGRFVAAGTQVNGDLDDEVGSLIYDAKLALARFAALP
jgi:uncharacterized delta-60 repeat protein